MNIERVENILMIMGLYVLYLIFTLIVFYVTGLYIWTTSPTKLVLVRIIVFPFIFTMITYICIMLFNRCRSS